MSDDVHTIKIPKVKNPFKRSGDNDKKHKRHLLLKLAVVYLLIKNMVDAFQTNATLEDIVKATKMDRSAFKDVDYKVDYIMNPFSLFGGLPDMDLNTGLILLLVAVVVILLVVVIKQNNNKKDEDHS